MKEKFMAAPPMTENLRYGTEYRTIGINTHYDFSREGGFATAVELCNGAAVCRKKNEGTMCPSYMVTLEDKHSTRGRANLMREILSGKLPAEEFTGESLYETLDLCVGIDSRRKLPLFAPQTFEPWFKNRTTTPSSNGHGRPVGKVILFHD